MTLGADTADLPPFPVHHQAMDILGTLWEHGHGAFLVGGGVRDALLGLPVGDWDVATDARPERILRIFPEGNYENRFGTVLVRGVEITTFRRDHRYADHRRPDSVTFSEDVYEDLSRRDLTINAIAWGRRGPGLPARLVDPADGQGDLRAGVVRAVGDPSRRFDEDALRLLRAVRIAARLGFTIEPVTLAAMTAHAADVRWVSEERLGAEVRGMLRAARPSVAFRMLHDTGILAAAIPELAATGRPSGPADDADGAPLERAFAALDVAARLAPGNERLALAALLGEVGSAAAGAALERLRLPGREADAIATLVDAAAEPYAERWSDADLRRYLARLPADLLDDVMALRRIRAEALGEPEVAFEEGLQRRVAAERSTQPVLTLADLAVDGDDLLETLGVPEGPLIGALLERLLGDVIEDPTLNQRVTLLTRASLILQQRVERATRDDVTPGESR